MATRFLIISDLHGAMPRLDVRGYDAIIAPGDFCSDGLREFFMDLGAAMARAPGLVKPWYDILGRRKAKAAVERSLKDGRRVLERLNRAGVPVFLVPGNWDWTSEPGADWTYLRRDHFAHLLKGLDNLVNCYHRLALWNGYAVIGHGVTSGPEFPQHAAERARYSHAELRLLRRHYRLLLAGMGRLFALAKAQGAPVLFLSHNVPYNTAVDKITDSASFRAGRHFGSVLARELVLAHRPPVCVGGHMHEHFGACRLGRTVVINAGFGPQRNVLLEMEGRQIRALRFFRRGRRIRPAAQRQGVPRYAR